MREFSDNTNTPIIVSVIIPVYNVEKYIRECIESVIAQTLKEIEIICINDGSTDKSADILQEYALKDSRIRIINQEHSGVASARNTGLRNISGKYVSFIDGDDAVHKEFLQKLYQALQYNKSADFSWCNFVEGTQQKYLIKSSSDIPINYNNPFVHYIRRKKPKMNALWNKLYSKHLLKGLSFPKDLCFGEDLVFLFQVLHKAKTAVYVPDSLYFYRNRPNSAMNTPISDKRITDELNVAVKLKEIFQNKSLDIRQKQWFENYVAKRLYGSVINFTKQKDKENYLYWYQRYLPVLHQLEKEKIFVPDNLSWKNKILYRFYLQRSKLARQENNTLLTSKQKKICFLGIPIVTIERQIRWSEDTENKNNA